MAGCVLLPSILDERQTIAKQRLALCEGVVDVVHIDIANNTLVPTGITADPDEIAGWDSTTMFELHLMVDNPNEVLETWSTLGNIKSVIVHAEATQLDALQMASQCEHNGWERRIGFKMDSDPSAYLAQIENLDPMGVLCMGIQKIGFSGQKIDLAQLNTLVANIQKTFPESAHWEWEIDGGVHQPHLAKLIALGFSRFVMASEIFSTDDPQQKIKELQTLLNQT